MTLKDITKNTNKLNMIVRENPDLPIITMVNEEIVADDTYAWWLGCLDNVTVYYINTDTEKVLIKGHDDEEDILYAFDPDWDELSEEEQDEILDSVKWSKAIILWIDVCNI